MKSCTAVFVGSIQLHKIWACKDRQHHGLILRIDGVKKRLGLQRPTISRTCACDRVSSRGRIRARVVSKLLGGRAFSTEGGLAVRGKICAHCDGTLRRNLVSSCRGSATWRGAIALLHFSIRPSLRLRRHSGCSARRCRALRNQRRQGQGSTRWSQAAERRGRVHPRRVRRGERRGLAWCVGWCLRPSLHSLRNGLPNICISR
mmetsp:Transcript_168150/g.322843  ORF Transcript_168150/g.322843 Transcript_168150/m.322843 type:complete len:203 (-) Transcript_168150:593-1201(-)